MRFLLTATAVLLISISAACAQQIDSKSVDAQIDQAIATYAAGMPTATPVPTESPTQNTTETVNTRNLNIVDQFGNVAISLSATTKQGGSLQMYSGNQNLTVGIYASADEVTDTPLVNIRNNQHSIMSMVGDFGTVIQAGEASYQSLDEILSGDPIQYKGLEIKTSASGDPRVRLGGGETGNMTISTVYGYPLMAWRDQNGTIRQMTGLDDEADPFLRQYNSSGDMASSLTVLDDAGFIAVFDSSGSLIGYLR